MNTIGTGIGNRHSALVERNVNKAVLENYAQRAVVLGKFPGTHSLGKEFETPKSK